MLGIVLMIHDVTLPGFVLDMNVGHGEAPGLHVFVAGEVSPYLSIVLSMSCQA